MNSMKLNNQILKMGILALSTTFFLAACDKAVKTEDTRERVNLSVVSDSYIQTQQKVAMNADPELVAAAEGLSSMNLCFKRLRMKRYFGPEDNSSSNSSSNNSADDNAQSESSDASSSPDMVLSTVDDSSNDSVNDSGSDSVSDNSPDQEDPFHVEDNVDFFLGEVNLLDLDSLLVSLVVPADRYVRIEADFESDCDNGQSLAFTNAKGESYELAQRVTIKIHDDFEAAEGSVLVIPFQSIKAALNLYDPSVDGDLRDYLKNLNL